MSIEHARAFVGKIHQDEAFRQSFFEIGSREKAMEPVKAKGYDFAPDEVRQVREECAAQ